MEADQLDATAAAPAPALAAASAPAAAAAGPAAPARVTRVRAAAAARGVPLAAILVTVGVFVLVYLAGESAYRLRAVILLMVVGEFITLTLNHFVVFVQRRVTRRGWAVTIVTVWALLIFTGLVVAFGYPMANGLTNL